MKRVRYFAARCLVCLLAVAILQAWSTSVQASGEALEILDMESPSNHCILENRSPVGQVLLDWLDEVFAWRVLP